MKSIVQTAEQAQQDNDQLTEKFKEILLKRIPGISYRDLIGEYVKFFNRDEKEALINSRYWVEFLRRVDSVTYQEVKELFGAERAVKISKCFHKINKRAQKDPDSSVPRKILSRGLYPAVSLFPGEYFKVLVHRDEKGKPSLVKPGGAEVFTKKEIIYSLTLPFEGRFYRQFKTYLQRKLPEKIHKENLKSILEELKKNYEEKIQKIMRQNVQSPQNGSDDEILDYNFFYQEERNILNSIKELIKQKKELEKALKDINNRLLEQRISYKITRGMRKINEYKTIKKLLEIWTEKVIGE